MSHELFDDAVPLAGLRVPRAVLPVRHQLQPVREAHLPRHRRQEVHAKTVKPRIPGVVLFVMHHHVRRLLRPCRMNGGFHARITENALRAPRRNADLLRDTLAPTISRNFQRPSRVLSRSTRSSKMGGTTGGCRGVETVKQSALFMRQSVSLLVHVVYFINIYLSVSSIS